jgi:hypothetical protein
MKLKDLLEMAAPDMSADNIQNVNDAIKAIQAAYEAAVVRKQPNEDVYGPLVSAMRWLGRQPNVNAYADWVRKGTAAVRAIKANRGKLSAVEPQSTTMKNTAWK